MSNWDWVHAGLEAATYVKARQAQQHLSSIESAMQSAMHAAEIEAARRAMVEAMRNFVFDISRDLQLAEEHIEGYPLQVFIVAKASEARFKESGLSPAVFPEFSDKEYVNNTQRKLVSVVNASRSKLSDEQMEQADIAVKYLTELPLLNSAITAKTSLEQIQATENDWKKLQSSVNTSGSKKTLGSLALLGSFCICGSFVMFGGDSGSLLGILFAGLVLVGAIALFFSSRVDTPRYNDLKAKREDWRRNLLNKELWTQVMEKFGGDQPSDHYQKVLEQRVAYLNPILGGEFQNFLGES